MRPASANRFGNRSSSRCYPRRSCIRSRSRRPVRLTANPFALDQSQDCAFGSGGVSGAHRPRSRTMMQDCAPLFQITNARGDREVRSEEHTSELQSLMRISYAVFCLKKKTKQKQKLLKQHLRKI